MIPTMLVFGLVLGRWWKVTVALGVVAWPALLLIDGTVGFELELLGAAIAGAANTLAGAAVHQGLLWLVRHLRKGRSAPHLHGR